MDTQAINNVVNPTAPKPKATAPKSSSDAGASTAPTGDTVSLSKQSQELAQQGPTTPDTTATAGSEQRKFAVTENNDVVLKVIDPQTQEVVRSVPSEEQLQLRDAIRNELDNI
ncbi:MAG: flagellar protein FlaG [Nitrospinae bacterium]|nr:flagellar protein FlaG [Nitrospinota bacterium]